MLYPNDIKEELSLAYIHAVASKAGFSVEPVHKDRDSIDLHVCARGHLTQDASWSPMLGIQAKAHVLEPLPETEFSFDLPVKNYRDLSQRCLVPRILVVLILPEDPDNWFHCSDDGLILRRCAYWRCLRGAPPVENTGTKRVRISRANAFTPEALRNLLEMVGREEELPT